MAAAAAVCLPKREAANRRAIVKMCSCVVGFVYDQSRGGLESELCTLFDKKNFWTNVVGGREIDEEANFSSFASSSSTAEEYLKRYTDYIKR